MLNNSSPLWVGAKRPRAKLVICLSHLLHSKLRPNPYTILSQRKASRLQLLQAASAGSSFGRTSGLEQNLGRPCHHDHDALVYSGLKLPETGMSPLSSYLLHPNDTKREVNGCARSPIDVYRYDTTLSISIPGF
jgi:hypothetical protein